MTCKNDFQRDKHRIKSKKTWGQNNFYCSLSCMHRSQRKGKMLDHKQVYDRYLEIKNFMGVAREFDISDVSVHKIVKKFRNNLDVIKSPVQVHNSAHDADPTTQTSV